MNVPDRDPDGLRVAGVLLALLRLVVIVALVALASYLAMRAGEILRASDVDARLMHGVYWAMVGAYALVLAVPFVPGVEIGLSLLMIRGADAALPVYLATVAGLSLAFGVGLVASHKGLAAWLRDCGLARAAKLVRTSGNMTREERLAALYGRMPKGLGRRLLDNRYIVLALLLNLPGNALLGGGGGIMLLAGLSGLFAIRPTLLTVAVAVAPVPLLVEFFGLPGYRIGPS